MSPRKQMVLWARIVAQTGYPPSLLAEYLMREFRLSAEEALIVVMEAFLVESLARA